MTCASCSAGVERALEAVPGVHHAVVSLLQQEARVEHSPSVRPDALEEAVQAAGFGCRVLGPESRANVSFLVCPRALPEEMENLAEHERAREFQQAPSEGGAGSSPGEGGRTRERVGRTREVASCEQGRLTIIGSLHMSRFTLQKPGLGEAENVCASNGESFRQEVDEGWVMETFTVI